MPSVRGMVTAFERQKSSRVVMSGHGTYFTADGKIKVPAGVTLHFYVDHGDLTNNAVGMAVENRFASTSPPVPKETFTEGQEVYNYRLSFGSRLDLAGSLSTYKYDWITVDQVDRMVPLSVLFRDPRCRAPCEVHWAACREIRAGSTDKGGFYVTRPRVDLESTGKSLNLVDSSGNAVSYASKIPGRLPGH